MYERIWVFHWIRVETVEESGGWPLMSLFLEITLEQSLPWVLQILSKQKKLSILLLLHWSRRSNLFGFNFFWVRCWHCREAGKGNRWEPSAPESKVPAKHQALCRHSRWLQSIKYLMFDAKASSQHLTMALESWPDGMATGGQFVAFFLFCAEASIAPAEDTW